jgi:hypothetical protein
MHSSQKEEEKSCVPLTGWRRCKLIFNTGHCTAASANCGIFSGITSALSHHIWLMDDTRYHASLITFPVACFYENHHHPTGGTKCGRSRFLPHPILTQRHPLSSFSIPPLGLLPPPPSSAFAIHPLAILFPQNMTDCMALLSPPVD